MIEAVSEKNLHEVLPLIKQYQQFYRAAEISDAKNKNFFEQFGENNPLGCQFLFRDSDNEDKSNHVIGFATVYFSFSSTIAAKVGILNDVFTLPNHRGKGVATALINHCLHYALAHGAARLQWVTAPDNISAQRLYNSLNTGKSTWHLYTYNNT